MKIFANFFEMIKYMSFCPICNSNRKIEISLGPDYMFNEPITSRISLLQNNNKLQLNILYGNKFGVINNIIINVDSHNFYYVESGNIPKDPKFFIYLQSQCKSCNLKVYSITSDIEFELDNKLSLLQVEEDYIYIDDVHVNFDYINQSVRIYLKNEVISVPIWNEDFSNKNKFLKKIKTILTFG